MRYIIRVPFGEAEKTPIFASSESEIDFDHDYEGADRCTVSFAAVELASHFVRMWPEAVIEYRSASAGGAGEPDVFEISLEISGDDKPSGSFVLSPEQHGISVTGSDRVGVLYGTYELLRLQGWRWLEPGPEGEYPPEARERPVVPDAEYESVPAFELWRGFDFSGVSMESTAFLVWMARNRLNLAGYRPATGALGRKLGMRFKNGGHIFEKILDPGRTTESGESFWDAHRAWYGTPAKGEKTRTGALRTQFCVSQPDLLEYLGEELVRTVETEWYEADLIAVWGFDTWGSCCTCDACRSLGNDSDQYLRLLSSLREALNRAAADGRVRRGVRMAGCAYEGTSTLEGPQAEIPAHLRDAGDTVIFYPIDRSYASGLFEEDATNTRYAEALRSWIDRPDALPMIVGEYYNVSKFEDLPALFSTRIHTDLPAYHRLGVSSMTYMHVPMVNWAVRAQTQVWYAEACWSGERVDTATLDDYLRVRYGPHAQTMAEVYRDVETAFEHIAEWRAWHGSLLAHLLKWNGRRPENPLPLPPRFPEVADAVSDGRRAVRLLSQSISAVRKCKNEERNRSVEVADRIAAADNPQQAAMQTSLLPFERVLGEDERLLRYGLDTMEAMTEVVALYDASHRGELAETRRAWRVVEGAADRLDSYWVPIGYDHPGPGLESKDALTRSQLREIINRCRAQGIGS